MLRTYFASLLRPASLIILLVLILVSVAIWTLGGALSIAGIQPFETTEPRIFTIVGLFVLFFLITFLRHALARRANARLINSMLANDELVSMGSDLSNEEIELIRERFESTLKTLRNTPIDGRRRRNYLFELPWYIIIGPPGTGKTTILRNSGLSFPLAEEGHAAVQGIGGTRNCDWWISNEAVLIDTAGRYTTQDVNQGIDAAAWGGFLDLLKEHRRRRPVNGVLLAISIADVALASEAERERQAETLRQRLRELHRTFGMRLPVYVLFTKCDLIAGFEEYFDTADDREREQVWGMTFPLDEEQMTFGPLFEKGFLDLVSRIENRLPAKLAEERNNGRRCRIYSFPHEFGSLATVLRGFVTDVFRVNRYEAQPLLRGVYFTSGTQEGTPFDRLLGAMTRTFSLAPGQQLPTSGQGKAFFIKSLLTDIVFAEQNLVGKNSQVERRLAAMHAAGYAAIIGIAVLLSAWWLYGLSSSLERVETVEKDADLLKARLYEADQNRSLANILPALDAARKLRQDVSTSSSWGIGDVIGIDARPPLDPAARETYDTVLTTYLLPTLTTQLQGKIQLLSNSADTNNLLLRDQLKTYLMLTTGENFAADQVRKEFHGQAEAAFPLSPDGRSKLTRHVDALVDLLPNVSQTDQPTVQAARNRLNEVPQATDIYRRMVSDAARRYRLPPVSIVSVLGTSVLRVDTVSLDNSTFVPGIYTKNGFYNFFLPRLPEYIRNSTGTDWVLGSQSIGNETYNKIAEQVVQLYVRDYIQAWNSAINQVRVIDFETLGRGQIVLRELSSPQSPLTKLLATVRENTELPLPNTREDDATAAAGQVPGANALGLAGNIAGSAADALQKTAVSTAFGDAPWPGSTIGDAFRPLNTLVDPQSGQAALGRVQQLFADMFGTVSGIATAPQPEAAAYEFVAQRAKSPTKDSFARLRAEAATKPDPVRSMVLFVVDRNWRLMMKLSYMHLNGLWQQEVVPVCEAILSARYPFEPGSKEDVSLQDFSDLFKPAGILDKFFTDYLKPFLVVKGRKLAELSIQGVSLGLSGNALAQFSRAQTIRDAFFANGNLTPETKFTIEPTFLDPKALKSSFSIDDTQLVYRHGPPRARDFAWPSKLEASVARLTITLLDGSTDTREQTGTWAMFRMLSASGLSKASGRDQFVFSIAKDDVKASYQLTAGSVTNPFNLGLYSAFRCPPSL